MSQANSLPISSSYSSSQGKTPSFTHITPSGSAHMVSVSEKSPTRRLAIAVSSLRFSNPVPAQLIRDRRVPKGDVVAVARIAGIMAAKRTSELIPLCHPLPLTHVGVDIRVHGPDSSVKEEKQQQQKRDEEEENPAHTETRQNASDEMGPLGGVKIEARVECTGRTGVEMEALVAANVAALTMYDMCKAVDKHMIVEGCKVVLKEGGKSGDWREEGWESISPSASI